MNESAIAALIPVAERIARAAHDGQERKNGSPYVSHLEAVVEQIPENSVGRVVAWLHDVLEDTEVSREDLALEKIPDSIIVEIELLTKKREQRVLPRFHGHFKEGR